MIELTGASASMSLGRGRRAVLANVSFKAGAGVYAVIGTPADGTSLLFDVIDGTVKGRGKVEVRAKVFRVSLDAPLPEALRVDEVCALTAKLRGEAPKNAAERLAVLGLATYEKRMVRSLSVDERRGVTLALALGSTAEILLVEEPFSALEPVVPRLVADALRARSTTACIVVTTASPRDALTAADRIFVLSNGRLTPIDPEMALAGGAEGLATLSVHTDAPAALLAALANDEVIGSVRAQGDRIVVTGHGLAATAHAVTQAIAKTGANTTRIEPSALPLDLVRVALAARAASPPPGSLPPKGSMPPPGSLPPRST